MKPWMLDKRRIQYQIGSRTVFRTKLATGPYTSVRRKLTEAILYYGQKQRLAHYQKVVAWCGNEKCVSPFHFEIHTFRRRMRGTKNPRSKLPVRQVNQIIKLHNEGLTCTAITERINKNRKPGDRISYRQVCRIAKGESRHNTVTVQRLTDLLELPEKVPSTAKQDDGNG